MSLLLIERMNILVTTQTLNIGYPVIVLERFNDFYPYIGMEAILVT